MRAPIEGSQPVGLFGNLIIFALFWAPTLLMLLVVAVNRWFA
jgi:hypothetical protein